MGEEVLVGDLEIPVKEEEELPFHQVDLRHRKSKAFITPDATISGPMLVLRTRVVQVLRRQDERGEENAVDGAWHPLRDGWEAVS